MISGLPLAVFKPGGTAATALYILAFSLFIFGLKQGTHPRTAKRGNMIAARRHGASPLSPPCF